MNRFTNFVKKSKKVVHKNSKKAKGWAKASKNLDRAKMKSSYFLIPKEKKFPYKNQKGQIDCRAIQSAIMRSRMLYTMTRKRKYLYVKRRALALSKKYKCNPV